MMRTQSGALPPLAETPLVTIVIPCYGQAHFLPEAIETALGQTYPRTEVVVVDDGSPDDAAEVAASYARVRCIRQENRGLAGARNRGLAESSGDCLVFLDSDDRLRPRAVELGLRALRQPPSAAFAYGGCALVDVDGKPLGPSPRPIVEGDHYLSLLPGNFLPNPAAITFRRDAILTARGFTIGVHGVEDYDLCLRLARMFHARGFPEVVADYRQHGNSLSHRAAVMSESMLKVLQSQMEHVAGDPAYEVALQKGLARWRREYYAELLVTRARQNARAGRWVAVLRDLGSLLRADPARLVEDAVRRVRSLVAQSR